MRCLGWRARRHHRNLDACHFDPEALLCSVGTKAERHCLTAQELRTVKIFATQQETAQPLWNGVQTIPGFNVLAGTDLTDSMGILHHAEHPPKIFLNSFYYVIGDQVLRFFLTGDSHFNALLFDTTTGGKFAADLLLQSEASDASEADLSSFARHGGKFLIVHGTTDATIPTNASVLYYKMVQSKMGQTEMDAFLRFYLIPSFGHGRGVFDAGFDALGVLDHWLDTNVAPKDLVVLDNHKRSHGRTRPLCIYPKRGLISRRRLNPAGIRTIAPWLRGFGETRFLSQDTCRDCRTELSHKMHLTSWRGPLLCDRSWGARTAYALAALVPERIETVTAVSLGYSPRGSFPVPPFDQSRACWYQWFLSVDRGLESFAKDPKGFAGIQWETWSPRGWFDDSTFESVARSFENPDWISITASSYRGRWRDEPRHVHYDILHEKIATLNVATLMVQGSADADAAICLRVRKEKRDSSQLGK
jgi:pimeloyl-ACP methyl ester carboxylesterase